MKIRVVTFEHDETTQTSAVLEIVEFVPPSTPTPRTWSKLMQDHDRRQMLLTLVAQIDEFAKGNIAEIVLTANANAS